MVSSWGTFFLFCPFLFALSGEREPVGERKLRQIPLQTLPLEVRLINTSPSSLSVTIGAGSNLWRSLLLLSTAPKLPFDPVPHVRPWRCPSVLPTAMQPPLTCLGLALSLSQHLRLPQLQVLIRIILDASKGILQTWSRGSGGVGQSWGKVLPFLTHWDSLSQTTGWSAAPPALTSPPEA